MAPLVIAGFVVLWRTPELRFIAVVATLILLYVLAWIPGKVYYADGTAPAVLAAGAAATERWIARAHLPRARQWLVVGACLVGVAVTLPGVLPILPASDVHTLPASAQQSSVGDSIGWPQKPPRLTSTAAETTCRPCSPARTPTGRGDPARGSRSRYLGAGTVDYRL